AMIAGDGGAKGGAVGEERALAGRAGRNGDVHRRARERAEQRAVELEGGSRGLQARDRGEVEVLLLERHDDLVGRPGRVDADADGDDGDARELGGRENAGDELV